MEVKKLEELGLAKNESKIYLALLKLGKVPVIKLIQETGLHRNIVYDNLKRLLEKGLASSLKKERKTYFKASSPDSILSLLEDKQKELNKKKKLAKDIIKEIQKFRDSTKEKEEFTLFEGYKGIISVLNSLLKEKKKILTTGASTKMTQEVGNYQKYFFPKWHKIRIHNRIPFKILYSEDMKDRGKQLSKMKYTEVRYIPNEFSGPISLAVAGDKISVIITWGKIPTALWINSLSVNKGIKNYFNTIWEIAKK